MSRQKVLVTNADKQGRVYDPPRWFCRIGRESRTFSAADWAKGGLQWVQDQLRLNGG